MKPALVDGYGLEPVDRTIVTEMEIGAVKRREFDTDETIANCSIFLNAFQANWFEAFERDALRQGSRWFKMPLFTGGELLWHTVRFRGRPKSADKAGEYMTYSFQLDVEKREGLMPGDLAELLASFDDPDGLYMLDDLLQKLVNVDLPITLPFAA
jgi:hypothetical protein